MIAFPTIMYKSPGQHRLPGGGTYNYIGAKTQEEFDAKMAIGWFGTSGEAVTAAGDKANGPAKVRPKWALKKVKKRKPSRPLGGVQKMEITPVAVIDPIPDDAPPTRLELETKAKELGIRFDGRTKDKKLGQLIQDRLKGE